MKDKFIFNHLIFAALTQLEDEDFVQVMRAVVDYGLTGKHTNFDDSRLNALFLVFEVIIDEDNKHFNEVSRE